MSVLLPGVSAGRDHSQGGEPARVELVEYGDFQCIHCGMVYQEVKILQDAMGEELKFVFRNFPLPNLHDLALSAAVSAEAAGLQGKYWPMHDRIFENQKYLNRSSLSRFALDIGLDLLQFERDRENKRLFQKVMDDFESGIRSGVNGTPTFFINGKRYNGFGDFDSLFNACRFEMEYELAD